MMQKELKDYTYGELITWRTGEAIMGLGEGKSIRTIVSEIVHWTTAWNSEIDKAQTKQENGGTNRKK